MFSPWGWGTVSKNNLEYSSPTYAHLKFINYGYMYCRFTVHVHFKIFKN